MHGRFCAFPALAALTHLTSMDGGNAIGLQGTILALCIVLNLALAYLLI